jgi:Tfp pilus assembly protein FimT
MAISIIAFIAYVYLVLATSFGVLVLELTVIVAVAALLAVLAWIGYTMTTTPRQFENEESS